MRVWGITDGKAGMVAQVSAMAEALGLQPEMKVITPPQWIDFFPNILFDFLPKNFIKCAELSPPYPDLVISCGRKAALVAAGLRKGGRGGKFMHIQDPQMSAHNFDLVIAMAHDKITGKNVIKTRFALHNITADKLAAAQAKFAAQFANYPKPHVAVLLGGSTNKYTLTSARMQALIAELQQKLTQTQGSLLITPSRRTGAENIAALTMAFLGNERVYIYDMATENPYMGLLACADEIIVSNDSVNMMTEAYATGKPVTILPLEGHNNTKPARFGKMLKTQPRVAKNEMKKLAYEVRKRLKI